MLSKWSYYFPFPPAVNGCSNFFTPLQTLGMVRLFLLSTLVGAQWYFLGAVICISLMTKLSLFYMCYVPAL